MSDLPIYQDPRYRKYLAIAVAILVASALGFYWYDSLQDELPDGIAMSNGRIEAEQINVATKYAGRIDDIYVREGDFVEAGQKIASMDAVQTKAQVAAARAEVSRAEHAKSQAAAAIAQREAELDLARAEYERAVTLNRKGHLSTETLDQRRARLRSAEAALTTSRAAEAEAVSAIEAARARLDQLQNMLDDMDLVAPRAGRVQYRVAEPGEVLAAGGTVVTLLDVSDVYMTIFLPARQAGRLALGDEARLILDPAADYVIPARVTFVSSEAQFTPKSVETQEERDNLMFRIKLSLDPELLARFEKRVKTGVRGVGYVRLDPATAWPDRLRVKLPEGAPAQDTPAAAAGSDQG
ncbi:HlyD family secretion protein [Parvibaculum indicum]|uniref:HlyD family secretion protein n=1 Tax=Parvibaculum indicum TaxID=562969 RepID=UPI0014204CAB|nr:HlyD family efflux transporter periplasmic adaptor subunit [Parvibaculum indicum]NIJ41377.1 HlyD family secretion protein [Parvibaculum indicum]